MLLSPFIPLNLDLCGGLERVALAELELFTQKNFKTRLFASKVIGKDSRVKQNFDISWKNRFLKYFYYYNFRLKTLNADIYNGGGFKRCAS